LHFACAWVVAFCAIFLFPSFPIKYAFVKTQAIFCEDNAAVFSFNDILIPIIVYFVLTMALHFALLGYFSANPPSKDYKEWKTQKLMNFIQALNALVTSFFVTAFYAWGFYSLDGSRESRWHGNNVGLMHALSLHIGLTLYDTWLYINYFPEKGIEFHTHHFMVTAAGLISLSTGMYAISPHNV
jgi:hypothetical protein